MPTELWTSESDQVRVLIDTGSGLVCTRNRIPTTAFDNRY